jgi:hypothetical protein
MKKRDESFEILLDQCLDALQHGEAVEDILARCPAGAAKLEPLLKSAASIRVRATFEPSVDTVAAARARLNDARLARAARPAQPTRSSWFDRFTAKPLPLAAIATIAVIAMTAILVVGPAMQGNPPVTPLPSEGGTIPEGQTPPTTEPTVSPEAEEPTTGDVTPTATITPPAQIDGNFVFYVSDEQNDIGDFQSLTVNVSSIQIKPVGEGPWLDIEPEAPEADLVQLQGERAQELWRGDVPDGEYQTVFVYIESVVGILADSQEEADIKLPSGKLHLETPFSVTGDEPVEFVFDITVHRTGQAGESVHYVLSPQASESGIGQPLDPVEPQENAVGEPEDKPGKAGEAPAAGNATPPSDVVPPGPGPGHPSPKFED